MQLARLLAERLGYRQVSRELLFETVRQRYGFTTEEVVKSLDRSPGHLHHVGEHRRRLLIAVQAALCELVTGGEVVYHGQMGHLLLPRISHVLRVRLIAPRARRMEMAMELEQLNQYEASSKIDRMDAERSRWTQFVFGTNWADPSRYDMVLNLENITVQEAADVVALAASRPCFAPSEASLQELADLTLTAQVRAMLITDPATADQELKVEVEQGHVRLRGMADPGALEGVIALINVMEGVKGVTTADPQKKKR